MLHLEEVNEKMNMASALCFIKSTDKFDAIKEVIDSCSVFDRLHSRAAFTDAVFKREFLESTGIGHSVAVAHGKLPSITNVTIGLGISREGIPFESVDGKPVYLLFVIGSSPDRQSEYLSSMSTLMRYMRNTSFRRYLKNLLYPGTHADDTYRSFFSMLSSQEFIRNTREGVMRTGTGSSNISVGMDCTI